MRGDWQIAQWLFARVPDESGRCVPNPISHLSRWKILDNLRRSLVEPFTFFLFVAGWLGLPGGPLYWTVVPLILMFFPTCLQLVFSSVRAWCTARGRHGKLFGDLLQGVAIVLSESRSFFPIRRCLRSTRLSVRLFGASLPEAPAGVGDCGRSRVGDAASDSGRSLSESDAPYRLGLAILVWHLCTAHALLRCRSDPGVGFSERHHRSG